MKAVHCAAVDLGATTGRVIVGTWQHRRLELAEIHRFPNRLGSIAGHDYWDLPRLWGEVREGLSMARRSFPRLASVGVDTWGADHVLVDSGGRLVFPAHAYRDRRTRRGFNRLASGGLGRIYRATGIPNLFYNSSLQLQETVRQYPAVRKRAARCLFLPDYFNFLLSGRMTNEVSIASTSQLLSVRGRGWSGSALRHFGLPRRWFAAPVDAGTPLGRVTGLAGLEGVQVIAVPGHDTACAFDAMPADPDGSDLYISSGTWSLVGFESETPLLGPEALRAGVSNERTGDGRFRPLMSIIGLWMLERTLLDFSSRARSGSEWSALVAAARAEPAPGSLLSIASPAFANPRSMRAAIDAQLRRRHVAPPRRASAYVRLICDSLGKGHADALKTFERIAGRRFRRILIVGGGSKNSLLCQATADAAGLPVASLQLEGSAVGNIGRQLLSLGAVESLRELRNHLDRCLERRIYRPPH